MTFFSSSPLGGIHAWGILLVIPLAFQGIKHQPFSMTQPFRMRRGPALTAIIVAAILSFFPVCGARRLPQSAARGGPFFICGEVPDNMLSQHTKEEVLSPYAGRCLAGLAFVRRRWGGRFSVVFAAGGGCACLREGGRGRRRRLRRARQAQAG